MRTTSIVPRPLAALAALATAALAACGTPAPRPVEIRFEARMGEAPARCNTRFEGIGAAATTVEIADARFYVTHLQLVREDGSRAPIVLDAGSPWQHRDVALLDFEDASGRCSEAGTRDLNAVVRGSVAAGGARPAGLAFELGVPEDLNHLDATTAPSPLNLNALFWSWQSGYIFTKVDLWIPGVEEAAEPGADSQPRPNVAYLAHLGSTGCDSLAATMPPQAPCARSNRVPVLLPSFDPSSQVVVLDVAAWVADVDVSTSVPRPPGCMSGPDDPDCPRIFANVGLDLATGRCVSDCSEQKLVRAASPLKVAAETSR